MGLLGAATLLLLLGGCLGLSSHSLHYVDVFVSEPGQQVRQSISVGYMDDQLFDSYDPKTRRLLPKVPWITKVDDDDPQYWDQESQAVWVNEQWSRVLRAILATLYNQRGGAHILKVRYGCELREDGSKGGHFQYAYDGRDFLNFNKETLNWTAADVSAQITKREWDADLTQNQHLKAFLEEDCIKALEKFLDYRRVNLLMTETPEMNVEHKVKCLSLEEKLVFTILLITVVLLAVFYETTELEFLFAEMPEVEVIFAETPEVKVNRKVKSPSLEGKHQDGYKAASKMPEVKVKYKAKRLILEVSKLEHTIASVVNAIPLLAGNVVFTEKRQDGYKAASKTPEVKVERKAKSPSLEGSDQGSNSSGKGSAMAI